ncbi:TPA: hypothetical protein ACX6SN_000233 [Photobacterium damselae]
MTKILTGVIGILLLLFICIFTNIPKGLYYEALYYILEPRIWNERLVITGSKPEGVDIVGELRFRSCNGYDSYRDYKYEAEDLGTSYRLELPVINKDNSCQIPSNININTSVYKTFEERYQTGWSLIIYQPKTFWSVNIKLDNTYFKDMKCLNKGVCYQYEKNTKSKSDIKVASQENINSLTHLTINFGK